MNCSLRSIWAGTFACLLFATVQAQTFTEVLRVGDLVPGTGVHVTRVDFVDVQGDGEWLIAVDSDGPTSSDEYLLRNSMVVWHESAAVGFQAPAGTVAGAPLDVVDINEAGDVLLSFPLVLQGSTTPLGTVLVRNGVVLIRTGVTPCLAPGLPLGSVYSVIHEAWQNNLGQILLGAEVAVGGVGSTPILLRVDVDSAGNLISESKLAMVGETLPGPTHVTPVQGFSFDKGRQSINDAGDYLWYVDDDETIPPGDPTTDSNIYWNQTVLYNEGDTFPVATGPAFKQLNTAVVGVNNRGDLLFAGYDRRLFFDDTWLFVRIGGGHKVVAHEDDPVPTQFPGPWLIKGSGYGGVIPFDDRGHALWFLDSDDPDYLRDTALFYDQDLILQEGVTLLSGVPVFAVPNNPTEVAMSAQGNLAICEVQLPGPFDAVFLADLTLERGLSYCDPAALNSTGFPGVLQALGSDQLFYNDLRLQASNLPPGEFGYFLNGTAGGTAPPLPGSTGSLCLTGFVGFYRQPGVFRADAAGRGQLALDFPNTPSGVGPISITHGQHWYFQCWYRDTPNATSNFTNALEIVFY